MPERTQSGPRWGIIAAVSGLIGILLAIVVSIIAVPNYLRPTPEYTFTTLLLNAVPILILLLPLTLIIVTGEIDISVGSTLGLSSASFGLLFAAGVPLWAAAFIAVLIGGMVGVLNGVLITVVGLPSLAVTIGTLALFRGVAVGMLGTTAVTSFPSDVTSFVRSNIPGTPIPVRLVDERLSTVSAQAALHRAGRTVKDSRGGVSAVATRAITVTDAGGGSGGGGGGSGGSGGSQNTNGGGALNWLLLAPFAILGLLRRRKR